MKDLNFFQKGVSKFRMVLLLGCLCMMGTISRSVAGEVDSTQVATWKMFGRVIDEQGEPIIGVAILEQGTTNGCVTDTLGNYKLTVKAGAGLRDIANRVVRALNGEESENRVISLQTGFGGGKTHT